MPRKKPEILPPDEALRIVTAERLAAQLDRGMRLIARCEDLASARRGDRIGAINAAARVMRANADAAGAFARVAQVEMRQRSIVEKIQEGNSRSGQLKSKFPPPPSDAEVRAELTRKLVGLAEGAGAKSGEADEPFDSGAE